MSQTTSNSSPSGSLPYRLLVVPWSDAPTSAPAAASASRDPAQFGQRVDLPGEVVQADGRAAGGRRAGAGADLEQAEVVVVGGAGALQERRAGHAHHGA